MGEGDSGDRHRIAIELTDEMASRGREVTGEMADRGREVTGEMADRGREVTVADLERWVEHGATWRTLELSDTRAVVELCTCYGEPVDRLQSEAPELIEFVRSHPQTS